MGLVKPTCPRCGQRAAKLVQTPAMQQACEDCLDDVLGLAAGMLTSGSMTGVLSTHGWFRRAKGWRRRERS